MCGQEKCIQTQGGYRRMATQPQAPDLKAIKERQQKAWSSGDYGKVGATLVIMAEMLCEAVDLRPGQRVLDVACGLFVEVGLRARTKGG